MLIGTSLSTFPSSNGHSADRPGNRAFSLLELLVALSLISILLGLALPGLSQAWQRAWKVHCASNQRQIAMVVALYATDYFDATLREGVSPWIPQSGDPYVPWVSASRLYFAQSGIMGTVANAVFSDPAHPNPNHPVHFAMNGIAFAVNRRGEIDRGSARRRHAMPGHVIKRPSEIIHLTAFTDDRDNSIARHERPHNLHWAAGIYDIWMPYHLWGRDWGATKGAYHVRRVGLNRHFDRVNNILHFDGHVSEASEDEILDPWNWFDGVPLAASSGRVD